MRTKLLIFGLLNTVTAAKKFKKKFEKIQKQFGETDGDDIIFTQAQIEKIKELNILDGENFDISRLRTFSNESELERNVANRNLYDIWDQHVDERGNKLVHYEFSETMSKSNKKLIQKAMEEIEDSSCIRFVPRWYNEPDYLRIFPGYGCWSFVGRKGGEQQISIGSCVRRHGSIVHEFLHALGFFHAQSRPDRDEYIKINWDNIKEGVEPNFMKLNLREWFNMHTPYDTRSVMHYSGVAFAKDRSIPSIVDLNTNGPVVAQRDGMSKWDKAQLCILYQCNACQVSSAKFTCGSKIVHKNKLCDGSIDCDLGQDEDCYRRCCDSIKITHNGDEHFLLRHVYGDEEEGAKDYYTNNHGQILAANGNGRWVFSQNDQEVFSWESFSSCPTDIVDSARSIECHEVYTNWSSWSACDPDCYNGYRSRERRCNNAKACEDDTEVQHEPCSPAKCAEMATATSTTTMTSTTSTEEKTDSNDLDLVPSDSAGSSPFGPPMPPPPPLSTTTTSTARTTTTTTTTTSTTTTTTTTTTVKTTTTTTTKKTTTTRRTTTTKSTTTRKTTTTTQKTTTTTTTTTTTAKTSSASEATESSSVLAADGTTITDCTGKNLFDSFIISDSVELYACYPKICKVRCKDPTARMEHSGIRSTGNIVCRTRIGTPGRWRPKVKTSPSGVINKVLVECTGGTGTTTTKATTTASTTEKTQPADSAGITFPPPTTTTTAASTKATLQTSTPCGDVHSKLKLTEDVIASCKGNTCKFSCDESNKFVSRQFVTCKKGKYTPKHALKRIISCDNHPPCGDVERFFNFEIGEIDVIYRESDAKNSLGDAFFVCKEPDYKIVAYKQKAPGYTFGRMSIPPKFARQFTEDISERGYRITCQAKKKSPRWTKTVQKHLRCEKK